MTDLTPPNQTDISDEEVTVLWEGEGESSNGDGGEGASPEGEGAPEAGEGESQGKPADPLAGLTPEQIDALSSDPRISEKVLQSASGQETLDSLVGQLLAEKEQEREIKVQAEKQAQEIEDLIKESEERGLTPLEARIVNQYKQEKAIQPIRAQLEEELQTENRSTLYAALDDILETAGIKVELSPQEQAALNPDRFPNTRAHVQAVLKVVKQKQAAADKVPGEATAARRAKVASEVASQAPPVVPGGREEAPQETDLRAYLREKLN